MEEDKHDVYDKAMEELRLREYPMLEGELYAAAQKMKLTYAQGPRTWIMLGLPSMPNL
jgi:hypothetical protein